MRKARGFSGGGRVAGGALRGPSWVLLEGLAASLRALMGGRAGETIRRGRGYLGGSPGALVNLGQLGDGKVGVGALVRASKGARCGNLVEDRLAWRGSTIIRTGESKEARLGRFVEPHPWAHVHAHALLGDSIQAEEPQQSTAPESRNRPRAQSTRAQSRENARARPPRSPLWAA